MVRKERTKPPYTLFFNIEPKYMKFLRSFGEMAVIATNDDKKMRSKLDVRGRTGIFVGYADDHMLVMFTDSLISKQNKSLSAETHNG